VIVPLLASVPLTVTDTLAELLLATVVVATGSVWSIRTVSDEAADTVLLPSLTQAYRVLLPSPAGKVNVVVTSFQPAVDAVGAVLVVERK
jgi:hypothetical protein